MLENLVNCKACTVLVFGAHFIDHILGHTWSNKKAISMEKLEVFSLLSLFDLHCLNKNTEYIYTTITFTITLYGYTYVAMYVVLCMGGSKGESVLYFP